MAAFRENSPLPKHMEMQFWSLASIPKGLTFLRQSNTSQRLLCPTALPPAAQPQCLRLPSPPATPSPCRCLAPLALPPAFYPLLPFSPRRDTLPSLKEINLRLLGFLQFSLPEQLRPKEDQTQVKPGDPWVQTFLSPALGSCHYHYVNT